MNNQNKSTDDLVRVINLAVITILILFALTIFLVEKGFQSTKVCIVVGDYDKFDRYSSFLFGFFLIIQYVSNSFKEKENFVVEKLFKISEYIFLFVVTLYFPILFFVLALCHE